MINKIIVEVGSTNTKIDIFNGEDVKRLEEVTILFKKNYKENNKINQNDIDILVNKVLELKKKYDDIFVCGTSIFRDLQEIEKTDFLNEFKKKTEISFNIISQVDENILTVLGATKNISQKACVFIGGGGSTEISIFDKEITSSTNSPIGVIDVMNKFPDLADDYATSKLENVMNYISERLELPEDNSDILILAGGGHESFVRGSKISCENNTLYTDKSAPIMMDIETRIKETERFYKEISLNEIKSRVANPDWWFATRAMCAFVLVIANKIKAKYIIPTNISMVYGIIEQNK